MTSEASAWISGPPPGMGRYWIVMKTPDGSAVVPVEVSLALCHRGDRFAQLLMKTLTGMAYSFADNRDSITHHRELVAPKAP